MTREEKNKKKLHNNSIRRQKNKERNQDRWKRSGKNNCPYDVEMNGDYGTCTCGGENYDDCLGDT